MATPNAGPFSPIQTSGGAAFRGGRSIAVVSSFGLNATQLGPEFPAHQIYNSERSRELEYREQFFTCKQHDWKVFDWNGAMRRPERFPTQPLIGNSMPSFYVPLDQRRPNAPYRLGRTIVGAFTTLIFGYGRWPTIKSDDPDTQDFANALVKAARLKTKMIKARNLGGACGSVGLSWHFKNGNPRVRVHNAKHLYVEEWEDDDEGIPAHVIELYQYPKDVWDEKKKKFERVFMWYRRDWTLNADIIFHPVKVEKKNPVWTIDEDNSLMHQDGFCHFVYIKNLPEDDTLSVDGQTDYPELYEQLNSIDMLNSTNVKGSTLNLDPTLVLKMHAEEVGNAIVKKGSDNALTVGPTGDATYLELSGTAVTAGHAAIEKQREQALEVAQCIVPDPNEVVGSATSSVALKIVYAPMLSKGDILRDQYGEDGILRILDQMISSARNMNIGESVIEEYVDEETLEPIIDEETGEPKQEEVQYDLDLPPRYDKIEVTDEDGNPTGEFRVQQKARVPGKGRLELEWPDYFKPTPNDKQIQATGLSLAAGGKQIMSQQTAVEQFAADTNVDPQEELTRIRIEEAQKRDAEAAMYPGTGGQVDGVNDLPEGAEPDEEPSDGEEDNTPPNPEG